MLTDSYLYYKTRREEVSITYSEFVFLALVIQHEMRMPPVILTSLASLVIPYISTLSHKWQEFRGKEND